MKLTNSIVAIIALSSMSFAGGDIIPPVFEQETVEVPVEPVVMPAPVEEEYIPAPVEEYVPTPAPVEEYVPTPAPVEEYVPAPTPTPTPVVKEVAPVVVAPVVAKALGLYIAGGLTDITASYPHEDIPSLFSSKRNQTRQIGFTGRLGYDFMDYLGAELRGTYGFAKVASNYSKYKQIGAYLKPNYDITDELNLYGLIGASKSNHAGIAAAETGLSYGAGLDYKLSNNLSIFTDVLNYMDKNDIPESWGLTIGAGYQF